MLGFLLVDKPAGPTSHDVVAVVRRRLGLRKVGHAGTLDPPATGLVVVGVGAATRLLRFVQRAEKTYETTGVLGVTTTTLDAEGEVVSERTTEAGRDQVEAVLEDFRGEVTQVPPAVSAIKVDGERAYRRAARGEDVVIEPRTITIHELELTDWDPPRFSLRVRCSSGTYIRTLVADVGDRLGCGAHVSALRRTGIGRLDVADAVPVDEVEPGHLRPVEDVVDLPRIEVSAEDARRAGHGQRLSTEAGAGEVLVVGPGGVVGVFGSDGSELRPVTVLAGQD